ncbi:MAG TPA: outer membrane beta-barrel protein [Kofleriaceae bacterium]
MRSLIVAGILASGSVASAGTYIGLGIGSAPSVGNDSVPGAGAETRSYRGLLGYSFGHLAIETELNHFDSALNTESYGWTMAGVDVKYGIPLGYGFDVYGRAGLQRTWLSADDSARGIYAGAGNGLYLGVGVELRLLPMASVFVDYERQSTTIDAAQPSSYGVSAGMFTLGAILHL